MANSTQPQGSQQSGSSQNKNAAGAKYNKDKDNKGPNAASKSGGGVSEEKSKNKDTGGCR